MTQKRITALVCCIIMLLTFLPALAAEIPKDERVIYVHALGDNPKETKFASEIYLGEETDVYFAVDDPNRGKFINDVHEEPQYDLNGYTLRLCYDPYYFAFEGDTNAPIEYVIQGAELDDSPKEDVEVGEDSTIKDENLAEEKDKDNIEVPKDIGYYVYQHGVQDKDHGGYYVFGGIEYATAFITVFYSGGYLPQKKTDQLWYNLAKLSLRPIRTGETTVFADIDSNDDSYMLELFAKNKESDKLSDQTFLYTALNGARHDFVIKDRGKPIPPTAKPGTGSYVNSVNVELTHPEYPGDCVIYYTTDGSDPFNSTTRLTYKNPIPVTLETTIRACAWREVGDKYSNTVDYTYKILPDRPYLFDVNEKQIPVSYSEDKPYKVLVSDMPVFGQIADESEVYYTFTDLAADGLIPVDDAEKGWVQVTKAKPEISVTKNRTVRLVTKKEGILGDPTTYFLSIRPEAPKADKASGEYDKKIDITLFCATPGATIYYTTDGSDPVTSETKRVYDGVAIPLSKAATLRAVSVFEGIYSEKVSYYYLFRFYDDFGVDAFYPSGVYEGSVQVTLTPNNPDCKIKYHTGDGKWQDYDEMLTLDRDTVITAKAVLENQDGTEKEGEPYTFTYKIKPLPPDFAPESTQFTNYDKISIFTPESTAETTSRFTLFYTLDGSDPITSKTRIKADETSDSAEIEIKGYTEVSAVVLKDGENSYSTVVTHAYDIVTVKPVKPLMTLLPGEYIHEIGGKGYTTQFMPVPNGTEIYFTMTTDGSLCPDPVPETEGTYLYVPGAVIPVKGNTVIKAVAVNPFGVKSDIGIFSYKVTPQAPEAAPSAVIGGKKLPVVPVDAVEGSTVKYKVGSFENSFTNTGDERFYIDMETGNAYRDAALTEPLGKKSSITNGKTAELSIRAELDGIESAENRYIYEITDNADTIAPPFADKKTGIYEERCLEKNNNNFLKVRLDSLNQGDTILYRVSHDGKFDGLSSQTGKAAPEEETWVTYQAGTDIFLNQYTVLQTRSEKNGKYSTAVSYVYDFIPLPPIITLPSGTYLKSEEKTVTIIYDPEAPTDKINTVYNRWYRENGGSVDERYMGIERTITKTMSFKAYVKNDETERVSRSVIHYYIIEDGDAASGSVYITYPFDKARISTHLIGTGDYAEGIKLVSQNKDAEIHYRYTYTRTDGEIRNASETVYDVSRPIIPTKLMDNITIYAWLVDPETGKITGSDKVFMIDFVDLGVPTTSLEESGKVEFSKGTEYTLINAHEKDTSTILFYTLDGSDPSDPDNKARIKYQGEKLKLTGETTIKGVYYNGCGGKCVNCKTPGSDILDCWEGIYGAVGTYKYTVKKSTGGGTAGAGSGASIGGGSGDGSRKYTIDMFGNEHPTHIGYINGYPDGSVKPEGDITREEITAILYRITNHDYEQPFVATGDAFPDVDQTRWSSHDIEYMADKEIVVGYPDGEFKPARNLTRAEFSALIGRFLDIVASGYENPFPDVVESHWAYNEILSLANAGLMTGYEDGSFRPEDNISRAEVMTVINKILGRKPLESYVKSLNFNPYNDLYQDTWYYVTVLEATITHNYWLNSEGYEYKWEDWK